MKKLLVGGLAVAALALPASASAQTLPDPVVTVSGKISKTNAGTAKKPTAVKLTFGMTNSAASQATVSRIIFDLPTGVKLDGSNLGVCKATTPATLGRPGACKAQRLGMGVAYASLVNKAATPPNCPGTGGSAPGCITFETTFFVGGKRLMLVFLNSTTPGFAIQKVLVGRINRPGRQLTIDIPADTQQPAPGTYSALQELNGSWFKTRKANGRVNSFVSTTGCPSRRTWAFQATLQYVPNPQPPNLTRKTGETTQKCTP